MPRVTSSALVPATAEEVFSFLADYRNIPRLQPEFTNAKLVSHVERGLGATVELHGRFHGLPMRAQMHIIAYSPPNRIVSISEGAVLSRNTWEVRQLTGEDISQVRLSVEYKVGGPLGGLFTGVASQLFHKEIQGMTDESLKRLAAILVSDQT